MTFVRFDPNCPKCHGKGVYPKTILKPRLFNPLMWGDKIPASEPCMVILEGCSCAFEDVRSRVTQGKDSTNGNA